MGRIKAGRTGLTAIAITVAAAGAVGAQDGGTAIGDVGGISESDLSRVLPDRAVYSPAVNRTFPTRPLFGDTHLHTAVSLDAGVAGARLTPADAYRFARGEQVTASSGQAVKLTRPLDFLVVADHSDTMGFFPALSGGSPNMLADPTGRR